MQQYKWTTISIEERHLPIQIFAPPLPSYKNWYGEKVGSDPARTLCRNVVIKSPSTGVIDVYVQFFILLNVTASYSEIYISQHWNNILLLTLFIWKHMTGKKKLKIKKERGSYMFGYYKVYNKHCLDMKWVITSYNVKIFPLNNLTFGFWLTWY